MKLNLKVMAGLCVLALGVSACSGSSSTSPSSTSNLPFSAVDLRVGTGTEATSGKLATVNYTGWLYDSLGTDFKGTLFDSSLAATRTPLQFTVFSGVIPGFSQCVSNMKVGGLRRCTIPPALGYGSQGNPPSIPPNATLIFEIELLSIP